MRLLYLGLALSACATAGRDTSEVGNRPDGGNSAQATDAAPLPDAPPGQQQVTLSQTTNLTPAAGEGIACVHTLNEVTEATADNSWYRVFRLADYNITGAFNLQRVTFYADYAYAGLTTSQPATINIGTYSGALNGDTISTASIAPIASVPIMIADTETAVAVDTNVTATIPGGSSLVVELALPDGYLEGNFFYIAVSAGGESKKGYIRSKPSGCGMTTPTSLTSPTGLNYATNSILMTVTGTK